MINFIVASHPRSGSTWLSNLLNTDSSLCIHDAMGKYTPNQLDSYKTKKKVWGIVDTAVCVYQDWANSILCPKIIVSRPLKEVNKSLAAAKLPMLDNGFYNRIFEIDGMVVDYKELFDEGMCKFIFEHLTNLPFDRERFHQLRDYNVQVDFDNYTPDASAFMETCRRMSHQFHPDVQKALCAATDKTS